LTKIEVLDYTINEFVKHSIEFTPDGSTGCSFKSVETNKPDYLSG